MKRAFTLIELLVVIAIIAILAAILFPVFAQAKEAAKKTAGISNVKQTGTSFVLYTADSDDTYPSASSIDDGGTCGLGVAGKVLDTGDDWITTTPAGADSVACGNIDSQAWVNSIQPYSKNYDVTQLPGVPTANVYSAAGMATLTLKAPATTGFTMNGLLTYYNATAVASPSKLTVAYAGNGKINLRGGTYAANPTLTCETTAPCRFNPGGMPDGSALPADRVAFGWWGWNSARDSMWHWSRGSVFVMADTSARFLRLNPSDATSAFSYSDPYGSYVKGNGVPDGIVQCSVTATAPRYPSFFRPDSEFNYPLKFPSSANVSCANP